MKRTHYSTELGLKNLDSQVVLIGWVQNIRKLGSITFIDLRDKKGIIQLYLNNEEIDSKNLKFEYLIAVKGIVTKKDVPNLNLETGYIEIRVKQLATISKSIPLPFNLNEVNNASEDTRLKYRYLDLRRKESLDPLVIRHQISQVVRAFLDKNDFLEVETPILTLSTPEGARDYLVPSRIHEGAFYALPQSPQLFKQVLMIGGVERYYQFARCFRDEDLRSDRQPDFTQIDLEMSFMDQKEILKLTEKLLKKVFKEVVNYDLKLPLRQISYQTAINTYGSDKPDTRFDLILQDLSPILKKSAYPPFKKDKFIKGIVIPRLGPTFSRKRLDELMVVVKNMKLNQIYALKYLNGLLEGTLTKFFDETQKQEIVRHLDLKEGDLVLLASHMNNIHLSTVLGNLRLNFAKELNLIDESKYDLLWVVDFPMFDVDKLSKELSPSHHPFTRPKAGHEKYLFTKPQKALAAAYDIVINGYEVGGGSLRIYDQELQERIFDLLKISKAEQQLRFGWFLEALKYGTPPHGGLAFGFDRLTMIMAKTNNIRDVIAFPKNVSALCPLTNAPQQVNPQQLDDLHLQLKGEKNE